MLNVFISIADEDQQIGTEICYFLESNGLSCWLASRDLPDGEINKGKAIIEGIEASNLVLLVLSENSNRCDDVAKQVELADKKKKTVFTVRIQDVSPSKSLEYFTSITQWVDVFDNKDLDRYAEVVKQINNLNSTVIKEKSFSKQSREDHIVIPFIDYFKVCKESINLFRLILGLNLKYYAVVILPAILLNLILTLLLYDYSGRKEFDSAFDFMPRVSSDILSLIIVYSSQSIFLLLAQLGALLNALSFIEGKIISLKHIWMIFKEKGNYILFTNLIYVSVTLTLGQPFYGLIGMYFSTVWILYLPLLVSYKCTPIGSLFISFRMIKNNFFVVMALVLPLLYLYHGVWGLFRSKYLDNIGIIQYTVLTSCMYMFYSALLFCLIAIVYKRLEPKVKR